jgi:hypothetical protein
MSPPPPERPRRRALSSGLLISLVFHVVVVGVLAWWAAREGMFGQPSEPITVDLIPTLAPENPPAPEKPGPEVPREKPAVLAAAAAPEAPAPAPADAPKPLFTPSPPVVAPAPAEMPSLAFDDGGETVQTENDPAALYRSFVEFSLRSRWNRPADIADEHYVAEVEVAVDAVGRISAPRWKRKSGNARWDVSVMDAVAEAGRLDRPPPVGFPARVTLRFDVVQSAELNIP